MRHVLLSHYVHYRVGQKSEATFTACNFRNVDNIDTKFGTNQRYFILNTDSQFI